MRDPERALRLLAELRRLYPGDLGLCLAAAREAATLGITDPTKDGRLTRAGEAVEAAREAYLQASAALTLDPAHGGAHHVVGRIHTGAKRLSWVTRLVARGLGMGAILDEASWEAAEQHLRRAVELDPDPLVHHVELAKLYLERGREAEGVGILEAVAGREPRHPLDAHYTEEARRILKAIRPG